MMYDISHFPSTVQWNAQSTTIKDKDLPNLNNKTQKQCFSPHWTAEESVIQSIISNSDNGKLKMKDK